jgi:pimeloyl-ACP methyl ester carboxylesterase
MSEQIYMPTRVSRLDYVSVRDAQYAVRTWGRPGQAPLLLLHGVRDSSITFQFLVDKFEGEHFIVAPDWRGHGATQSLRAIGWFHEYLADLDVLLRTLSLEGEPLAIVGHSMGGNVATVFAALRPEKVKCMVALDSFGVKPVAPAPFLDSLVRWLDRESNGCQQPGSTLLSCEAIASALQHRNPRLPLSHALFLARELVGKPGEGAQSIKAERRSIQLFHGLNEWTECWHRIRCPALWLASSDPLPGSIRADKALFDSVCGIIGENNIRRVPNTGHNMHHDAPQVIAKMIEDFVFTKAQNRKLKLVK